MGYRVHLLRMAIALVCIGALAHPLRAQTGRVGGVVRDDSGKPIKGATVTAENPNASPSSFAATTDEKGRFSIIGLRSGQWTFTAQAPGFTASQGSAQVGTIGAPNPPITFTLAKSAAPAGGGGPLAGVGPKEMQAIQADLRAADALMTAGQYDEAITAYQAIKARVPAATMINLAIGRAYRMKKERDYDKAIEAYQEILKVDPNNEKARTELGMTLLEKGDLKGADDTLSAVAQTPAAGREVFYNLGEVKYTKGELDEAAKWYQRAADTDATWMKPVVKLGLVAVAKGDTATAVTLFEKVVAAEPSSAEGAQAAAFLKDLKKPQ